MCNRVFFIGHLGQNAEAKTVRTTKSTSSSTSQPEKAALRHGKRPRLVMPDLLEDLTWKAAAEGRSVGNGQQLLGLLPGQPVT
jgi:hypothetical protein